MTRARLATSLLAIAVVSQVDAAQVAPGEVSIAVIRNSEAVAGLNVVVDGKPVGVTDANGRLNFMAVGGLHRVVLNRGDKAVAFSEFRLGDADAAEIAVTLPADVGDAKVERDIFDTRAAALAEIKGTVADTAGRPLAGVSVSAAGTSASTATDASGAFNLRVPRGEYTVKVAPTGGTAQDITGVRASPLLGGPLAVSVAAAAAPETTTAGTKAGGAAALGTVTVKGVVKRQSTVTKERVATSVIDSVSQEEIAAAGDSNAGEAIRRVTGVSVQNNVVVVRGLGDRYSTTLVNGAEIPSFNPSRRVVAVDAFPSEFLGGLTVQKTYSADLPGEFSGGVALIETRPTPDFQTAAIRVNAGGNTQTTLAPVLTYQGSDFDYLGADGGQRDLPAAYRDATNNGANGLNGATPADRLSLLQSLPNLFDLQRIDKAPADFGGSLTYGNVFKLGGTQKFGFQLTGLYDTNFRFRREQRGSFTAGGGGGQDVSRQDVEELQRSEQTFETGGTLGLGYEYSKQHKVDFVTLLSRQTQKGAFFGRAVASDAGFSTDQERITLDYVEGQLLTNQLTGKHNLVDVGGLKVKWQAGYSIADRDVLDRRTYGRFRAVGTDEPFLIGFGQSGEASEPRRTWEFLQDKTLDLGVDLSLPFEFSDDLRGDLKWGVRGTRRDRDFESVRFAYSSPATQRSELFRTLQFVPSLENVLTPTFFGSGGFDLTDLNVSIRGGGNANVYDGSQDINAFYVLSDVFVGDQFEIQAGARIENSTIAVETGDPAGGATVNSRLADSDILPSLNATWFISRQTQVRLGLSQSLNRPQFRELAEVDFLDPETRFLTVGNSQLVSAKLTNYDLRFEQYWSNTKAASIGVFYKDIRDPIEFNIDASSGNQVVRSFQNANSAKDYGIELDARYDLGILKGITPLLQFAYVAGNFSRIESEVSLPNGGKRQLQGQSNYLVNATLGYSNPASRTDATLLFNIFGDRLAEVGINDLPNSTEKSYPVLDFNIRQGIGQHWQVGIKARNILNPRIDIEQGQFNGQAALQRSYKLGRSGQISLQYQF
ncbi:TonB-dependent receptor [Nevskia sp.]|uniref:TonB-dependent receptor n=1 Tax=Nevskia sp. TaxID=1929292 RepID=UPI0025D093D3|nr:TonB-dependent receptor [Nevskia sp.]